MINLLQQLNWLDWIIVSIIGASALLSFVRGFFREALSLVIWLIAIVISFTFYPNMGVLLEPYITSPSLRQVSAIVSLFVVCLIVGGLCSFLLGQLVKFTGLGPLDRLLGVVFGFLRGVVIVVLVLMVVRNILPVHQETWWYQSLLVSHVTRMESSIMLLVMNVRDMIFPLFNSVSRGL